MMTINATTAKAITNEALKTLTVELTREWIANIEEQILLACKDGENEITIDTKYMGNNVRNKVMFELVNNGFCNIYCEEDNTIKIYW